ncbi:MAG TPA: orotidine-5'-phosphate decarboxylase [Puia sp.]|jgi:orotidine-5'-phosphate decarboxylase|nr:orotidine-5'-phosphate decarboxylase [Puia sp.]
MTRPELVSRIRSAGSYLCVGLDTDIDKIPQSLRSSSDPVFEFNRRIIDATKDHCVAYKINTAFYEVGGARGWETMEKTVAHIPPSHFTIADAKRGDIGNTSSQYARAFFETLGFDAVTVAPYMGEDSVRPFLEYPGKWTIVLGLTSNSGAGDFELQPAGSGLLYEKVLTTAAGWGSPDNLMFVVGATQAAAFTRIRQLTPEHFYLVPGIGAQGGSLEAISNKAMNSDVGLLVNSSREIIYASGGEDFAQRAAAKAAQVHGEMKVYLE